LTDIEFVRKFSANCDLEVHVVTLVNYLSDTTAVQ